jgi:hypothetical protein
MGALYCCDNLDILRPHLKDETVDPRHLRPPFSSAQNYNARFREKDGIVVEIQADENNT